MRKTVILSILAALSFADALNVSTRRRLIAQLSLFGIPAAPALAKDELFKPNPLTNPVLEQLRIWEQAEADTIKYKGELERGDAKNSDYANLLVPILEIARECVSAEQLVKKGEYAEAEKILSAGKYDKIAFKKIFNKYGDNIYYTDPDQANAYLGGGATPKNTQSLAYLLRNDILTNIEDLQAELQYVRTKKPEENEALILIQNANEAMRKYLELVPPAEFEEASKALQQQMSG